MRAGARGLHFPPRGLYGAHYTDEYSKRTRPEVMPAACGKGAGKFPKHPGVGGLRWIPHRARRILAGPQFHLNRKTS